MKKITEEEFQNYRPLRNPHNRDAAWDGCLYETYGAEYNFVRWQPEENVWTLLTDGTLVSGRHHVDRVGYIVTYVPWEEDVEVFPETFSPTR